MEKLYVIRVEVKLGAEFGDYEDSCYSHEIVERGDSFVHYKNQDHIGDPYTVPNDDLGVVKVIRNSSGEYRAWTKTILQEDENISESIYLQKVKIYEKIQELISEDINKLYSLNKNIENYLTMQRDNL